MKNSLEDGLYNFTKYDFTKVEKKSPLHVWHHNFILEIEHMMSDLLSLTNYKID